MQRPVMVIMPEGIMQTDRKINLVETLAVGARRKHTRWIEKMQKIHLIRQIGGEWIRIPRWGQISPSSLFFLQNFPGLIGKFCLGAVFLDKNKSSPCFARIVNHFLKKL